MSAGTFRRGHLAPLALGALAGALLLAGCERPPPEAVQRGYRGTGMVQVYNPRDFAKSVAANPPPPPALPPAVAEGPRASQAFKNVQVLSDLSVGELARVMLSMTQWVAPQAQQCAYCHNLNDMASDELYTKRVARRMLQMVREVNTSWTSHVAQTGVTCYTCHRGQQVPTQAWFTNPGPHQPGGLHATLAGKNVPLPVNGMSSLAYDPLTELLIKPADVKLTGEQALPAGNRHSLKQTYTTYGLMMYMSGALGVNCTYCHNTHSFKEWASSPPTRVKAWYGIRMVRQLNSNYLLPLHDVLPPERLGPTGDVAKVGCATCHKGVYKPVFGAPMLKDFPELGPPRVVAAPPAPAAKPVARTADAAAGAARDTRGR
ncbi:MAG: photosynthetic reaction center cytochrome c subunit [Proteobacteria bacterium]|nr:photosynthetic reaction center cytochrome c subunit [Pseudomonadota bacterium]